MVYEAILFGGATPSKSLRYGRSSGSSNGEDTNAGGEEGGNVSILIHS